VYDLRTCAVACALRALLLYRVRREETPPTTLRPTQHKSACTPAHRSTHMYIFSICKYFFKSRLGKNFHQNSTQPDQLLVQLHLSSSTNSRASPQRGALEISTDKAISRHHQRGRQTRLLHACHKVVQRISIKQMGAARAGSHTTLQGISSYVAQRR